MQHVMHSPIRWNADPMAVIAGAVFIVIAILGWAGNPLFSPSGVFAVRGAHNLAHLATGVILICAAHLGNSSGAIRGLGVVYFLLALVGLMFPSLLRDVLAVNAADNWLHALFAAILLAIGFAQSAEESIRPAG